jgi:hypothetical protein
LFPVIKLNQFNLSPDLTDLATHITLSKFISTITNSRRWTNITHNRTMMIISGIEPRIVIARHATKIDLVSKNTNPPLSQWRRFLKLCYIAVLAVVSCRNGYFHVYIIDTVCHRQKQILNKNCFPLINYILFIMKKFVLSFRSRRPF